MNFKLTPLISLLILPFFACSLSASETGYEVELIIFEDTTARYLGSEDWSYNDMLNNKKQEQVKNEESDPEYSQLNWEGAKLDENLKRLEKNPNFRVLLTKRWKQTGLDREHAFNIPVDKPSINTEIDASNEDSLTQATEFSSELIPPQEVSTYLNGSVKLIMSRYLHFNVNIRYIKPQTDANGEISELSFPVVNERRMRSREIHYIDHPLVGIIVLATPYKIKSLEEPTKPAEYKTM